MLAFCRVVMHVVDHCDQTSTMAKCNDGSMLSPGVHHLVCEIGMCTQGKESVASIQKELLDSCCSLNWMYLDQLLPDISGEVDREGGWYKMATAVLSDVFAAVENHILCMESTAKQQLLTKCIWTGNEKVFHQCWDMLMETESQHYTVLAFLKMTAVLERALGDVYLIKSKPVPSLLKDLLASEILKNTFGKVPMCMLDVLIGPPTSLNLRNLVWHGFISPLELPKRYCFCLLAVVASLGDIVLQKNLCITRRKLGTLSHCRQPNIFPVLEQQALEELENLGVVCSLFPEPIICWKVAFIAIKNERYSDAVTILFPLLESTLRRIFVLVNSCPARLLTAESSVLYTTFNEIVSQKTEDYDNKVRNAVGDTFLTLLFDMLVFPDGLRLRDRLSHGEIDLTCVTLELCNFVMCTTIAACIFLKRIVQEKTELKLCATQKIIDTVTDYKSLYAPLALLIQQEISLVRTLDGINVIKIIISDESSTEQDRICCIEDLINDKPHDLTLLLELAHHVWNKAERNSIELDVTHFILYGVGDSSTVIDFLSSIKPAVLYRPQEELELLVSLRHISTSTFVAAEAMKEVLQTRYDQYLRHELRSRQRTTYHRMTNVLPLLYCGLRFVLLLLIADNLSLLQGRYDLWIAKLRVFRLVRHFVENLEVMVTIKKNRWTESKSLTEDFLTSLHSYLNQPE